MKLSLRELNKSYSQLQLLCAQEVPKGQEKLAYKLGRIKDGADSEIERMNKSLYRMAKARGFLLQANGASPRMIGSDKQAEDELIAEFNEEAELLMDDTIIELWGVPFTLDDIKHHFTLTGEMCAKLGWLIRDEDADAESQLRVVKSQAAD